MLAHAKEVEGGCQLQDGKFLVITGAEHSLSLLEGGVHNTSPGAAMHAICAHVHYRGLPIPKVELGLLPGDELEQGGVFEELGGHTEPCLQRPDVPRVGQIARVQRLLRSYRPRSVT
jgi:hypothetical protein